MEFQVLGQLRVVRDGGVLPVAGVLQRTLLAVLLARGGRAVPSEVLAETLWPGETPLGGLRRLQVHVSRLRRQLDEPDRISFDLDSYQLVLAPGELDAERFESAVAEAAAATDPARCVRILRPALDLWRGEPFEQLDVPLLADEARRLREHRLTALDLLYTAELHCGRHADILPELTELVRENPLSERAHWLLISALHRSGRRPAALAAYLAAEQTLDAELGLEPGPQLRALAAELRDEQPVRHEPPAQLPHHGSGFVGRQTELSTLDELALAGRVCVITGTAGVGKTALAMRWAHRARGQFEDGQLYVDLRGYGPDQPVTPADALAGFLRELGVAGTAIPADLGERAARFRSLVDGRRLLIVLDNARSADQVRPLLPGSSPCFVLVTSRDSLPGLAVREGARRVQLGRLADRDAHTLLREQIGERAEAEPSAVDTLVEQCARLPLALRIAAELINARATTTVAELVAELAGEEETLDLLAVDGDQHTSVRAVFSWSYRHLPPEAARLFRLCGLHPGHELDHYALAALAGDLRTTRRTLDILVRAHLVEETPDRRLHLHDLLRSYAAELAESTDSAADRQAARGRLFDYYLHTAAQANDVIAPEEGEQRWRLTPTEVAIPPFADPEAGRAWLDVERSNLLLVADQAPAHGLPSYTTATSVVLCRYLDVGLYLDEASRLHTAALAIAEEQDDAAAEGIALRGMALAEQRIDNYKVAAELLERAREKHEGLADRQPLATTLNYLAGSYYFTGHVDEAIRHLTRSIDLYGELGLRTLRSGAMGNLGYTYWRQGRYDEAQRLLEDAVAIAEEVNNQRMIGHGLRHLAGLHCELGRYEESLRYAHRALAMSRFGIHNLELAVSNVIGTVHLRLGDRESAMRYFRETFEGAVTMGDHHLRARALNGMGDAQENPTDAVHHYESALRIATSVGTRHEEARALAGLGDANAGLGDRDAAERYWRAARTIFAGLGAPQVSELDAKLDETP